MSTPTDDANSKKLESGVASGEASSVDELANQEYEEWVELKENFSEDELKKLLFKIDIRLVPVFVIIYLLCFLDRGNIGNARVAGMQDTLELTGEQYNMCLTIFFFPYALLEVPSNIILKLLRPKLWITIMMVSWGTVMTLMGIVQNYEGLLAARFCLGVAETGFFPAAAFIITTWYGRFEQQRRTAYFYTSASTAGAFSGLLAFAISKMDGAGGLEGWRWIFILEGIATVVVGCMGPWIVLDVPERAGKWLTDREKKFVVLRQKFETSGKAGHTEKFHKKFLWMALTDWQVYLSVVMFWGNSIPTYALTYTMPTIIREFGYTAANAQLLTVPPYIFAALFCLGNSIWADVRRRRFEHICLPFIVGSICLIVCMVCSHIGGLNGVQYAFLFGVAAGAYGAFTGIISWLGNNTDPNWKRAVAMAAQISIGNLGGAIGSNIFLQREAPEYSTGYGVALAVMAAGAVAAFLLWFFYRKINRKRDKMTEEQVREKYTQEQLNGMGDRSPLYRYVL